MENKQLRIGCVVMAAGNARRFGENKLAAVFQGKSLLQPALKAAKPFVKLSKVGSHSPVDDCPINWKLSCQIHFYLSSFYHVFTENRMSGGIPASGLEFYLF